MLLAAPRCAALGESHSTPPAAIAAAASTIATTAASFSAAAAAARAFDHATQGSADPQRRHGRVGKRNYLQTTTGRVYKCKVDPDYES